jgi:hypothetical protein
LDYLGRYTMSESALSLAARYNARVDAADKMIERRVAGGSSYAQSRKLFAELCASLAGDNLVSALVYNGFATEVQASKYAEG